MLHVLVVLIPLTLIACSPDRPMPVAPAGKASDDFSNIFDLFRQQAEEHETQEEEKHETQMPDYPEHWMDDLPDHAVFNIE